MAGIRALLARFLPQGAILLSILTFTAYGWACCATACSPGPTEPGRNSMPTTRPSCSRSSPSTSWWRPGSRRRSCRCSPRSPAAADAAPRFAQTVLTLAVMVMSASSLLLLILAPATVRLVAPGFDESQPGPVPRPVPADAA